MWLTRDKDESLYLSIGGKPIKRKVNWSTHRYAYYIELDSCLFLPPPRSTMVERRADKG